MDSVLKFKKEDGWFMLPYKDDDGSEGYESCETLADAINSYYGINFCGCGDREAAFDIIYKVLDYCRKWTNEGIYIDWLVKNVFNGNEGAAYFVLYSLDKIGLTEHGSSIHGSWLTEKGQCLISDLEVLLNT
jgi:hypothetical protein